MPLRRIAHSVFGFVCMTIMAASQTAFANQLSGTIHTMHVNLETNMAHVYFTGSPAFDGGGCGGRWTGNLISDDKFMTYIWPLLAMAKSRNLPVLISVSGCVNGYPKIYWVDVEPRE
jgi:hypothetical protein